MRRSASRTEAECDRLLRLRLVRIRIVFDLEAMTQRIANPGVLLPKVRRLLAPEILQGQPHPLSATYSLNRHFYGVLKSKQGIKQVRTSVS